MTLQATATQGFLFPQPSALFAVCPVQDNAMLRVQPATSWLDFYGNFHDRFLAHLQLQILFPFPPRDFFPNYIFFKRKPHISEKMTFPECRYTSLSKEAWVSMACCLF
jgi:hypothetical protein